MVFAFLGLVGSSWSPRKGEDKQHIYLQALYLWVPTSILGLLSYRGSPPACLPVSPAPSRSTGWGKKNEASSMTMYEQGELLPKRDSDTKDTLPIVILALFVMKKELQTIYIFINRDE